MALQNYLLSFVLRILIKDLTMKILTVANEKGGVGKTFLATQYAFYCALQMGLRVAVIDLDQQANATTCLTEQNFAKKHELSSFDLIAQDLSEQLSDENFTKELETSGFWLFGADNRLAMLERQGDEAHSLFVSAFEKNLNALSSSFDVCIIDTNPSPDIRSNLGLLVCTHLIAPIQLNKEAIDGISRIVDRVNEIAEYNSNFPNAFLGMLPNAIESNKFQQKNAIDLTQNYGAMLICEKSYGFAASKNDKGQLVPVIEDGNYKLVDREAPLGIKRRTCIAESQAFGTPIWDSPNSADAWSELRKVFFTIYENMHITRLNSASEEQLSILNECASLYGKNSFKKIIRQFLMTGNARLLPRLSLEKANALRDLKKSISLDFLANFTPSI